jgi:hypothetical protein
MNQVLFNGGWLVALPLVLNLALYSRLPKAFGADSFSKNVPAAITLPENALRIVVFAAPFCMRINLHRLGALSLYFLGFAVYGGCWLIAVTWQEGSFVLNRFGFTSLAYTPALWLLGIGLSTKVYWGHEILVRYCYVACSVAFVVFHTWHAHYIYKRTSNLL